MKIEQDTELIEALAQMFPNSKRNTLRKMLTAGRVKVDEEIIHKAKFIVQSGSNVSVTDREEAAKSSPPPAPKKQHSRIKILHEDDHIIVVNKQAGLLSVATDKMEPDTLHSRVVEYLKNQNEKAWAFIVHRLDRETSGVMVFAKHKWHKEYLQEQFANRQTAHSHDSSTAICNIYCVNATFQNISHSNGFGRICASRWHDLSSDGCFS